MRSWGKKVASWQDELPWHLLPGAPFSPSSALVAVRQHGWKALRSANPVAAAELCRGGRRSGSGGSGVVAVLGEEGLERQLVEQSKP